MIDDPVDRRIVREESDDLLRAAASGADQGVDLADHASTARAGLIVRSFLQKAQKIR